MRKREVNLYEPYKTPGPIWVTLRTAIKIVLLLLANIRLKGRYKLPRKGPYIIVSNHLSWLDVPLVPAYMSPQVVYMAKEELFHSKIGWLVRLLGAFPVKRGEGDRQAIRAAGEQLKAGNVFIIFPEGTRSKTHTLGKGHPGMALIALRSGVPVIPVAVNGSEKILKQWRPTVTVNYGDPIYLKPAGKKISREDIEEASETIMLKIAEMLPSEYRGEYEAKLSQNINSLK